MKAKLLLSVILIIAVAGGTLAFKVNRSQLILFQKNAQGTLCTKRAGAFNPSPLGALMTNVYTTAVASGTTVPTNVCTMNISVSAE